MPFGLDTSDLEADLAKVERRLKSLHADDALTSEERELRSLYYLHVQGKLRSLLARSGVAREETGKQLDTASSSPEPLKHPDSTRSSVNTAKPFEESWKVITPPVLFHAVANVRKDFGEVAGRRRRHFAKECFKNLHPLASGLTEPAVFRKYFYDCIGELRKLLPHVFGRLLAISLAQEGEIGEAAIEWAALQVTDLLEMEVCTVDRWVKTACDEQDSAPESMTTEAWTDYLFWTDWRAPKWLYMEPNGNARYDASTAWERMDETFTEHALKVFRQDRWILLLESTLEELVGTAHEVLATKEKSSQSRSPEKPHELRSEKDRSALTYRSDIKRAILVQLTKQPRATDAEICRGLDADGAVELPEDWKSRPDVRMFFEAYSDHRTRHRAEVAISKVRKDMRKRGLLA